MRTLQRRSQRWHIMCMLCIRRTLVAFIFSHASVRIFSPMHKNQDRLLLIGRGTTTGLELVILIIAPNSVPHQMLSVPPPVARCSLLLFHSFHIMPRQQTVPLAPLNDVIQRTARLSSSSRSSGGCRESTQSKRGSKSAGRWFARCQAR